MLTQVCQYLHNWFNRKPDGTDYPKANGQFHIVGDVIVPGTFEQGQYIRIMGSLFNDGVHQYGVDTLIDETFTGSVWSLGIPPEIVQLATDIEQWQALYGSADSAALSPFQSESFGGYSYSKSSGGSASDGSGSAGTWQSAFAARLAPWRKL